MIHRVSKSLTRASVIAAIFVLGFLHPHTSAFAQYINPFADQGSVVFTFVSIKGGQFQMGSPADEAERHADQEELRITYLPDYDIMDTEVTVGEWKKVMGKTPQGSNEKDQNVPVTNFKLSALKTFISKMNKAAKKYTYGLPSSAQWECAARAGTNSAFFFGKSAYLAHQQEVPYYIPWRYGWYADSSNNKLHLVGDSMPNPWGLYDMVGNAREVVEVETLHKIPYSANAEILVNAIETRGGGFRDSPKDCRSAAKIYVPVEDGQREIPLGDDVGFRLVRTLRGEASR